MADPADPRRGATPAIGRWRDAPRWFWLCLLLATVVGGGIRVAYLVENEVPEQPGFLVNYDPIYYHLQGTAVAEGRGFVDPVKEPGRGYYIPENEGLHPSAAHPPGLTVAVAVAHELGVESFRGHRLLTTLLGTLAIPLVGLLGAAVAGYRTGAVAAALAAVYAGLWANDGLLMPESLYAPLVALALLLAYRAWERPTWSGAAALGATITLASFTRGEGVLLVPMLGGVVALWGWGFSGWRHRLGWFAAVTVAFGVVLAPWTAYNLSRFEEPVILSTAADGTLAGANCDVTASGENLGFWSTRCFEHISADLEDSVHAVEQRELALDYMRTHKRQLPKVVAARVGRVWSVFRPTQEVTSNQLQNRPRWTSWLGLGTYAVLVPLAIVGAVLLRRRGRPIAPLVAMFVLVTLVAGAFYGNTRFRIPADLALVVLAAVPLAALLPGGRVATGGSAAARREAAGSAPSGDLSGAGQREG